MTTEAAQTGVLVVDDERDIREGAKRILERVGFSVRTAERGDAALDILAREPPDIVLLDLKMPGMDGMTVMSKIHEMDERILVIVITGYATVETAIEAMKQGAYDFIPKPFEPEQLRIVVNRGWEKLRLTQEAERAERERRRTLTDLDTEKSRVRSIVESLPDGVLVTNAAGRVVLINPACRQLLELPEETRPGEPIETYLSDPTLRELIKEISAGRHIDYDDIPDHELAHSSGRFLLARAQPVLGERRECLGAVVNFVDITEMKVLDRLKSEFVAKVSHELRSPLSTIHEQLATVMRDMVEKAPPQDQHLLTRAKAKTQALISMIGDMLDLSRIEEGALCRDQKPVQVDEILSNVTDFLRDRTGAADQTLTLTLPEAPLPTLTVDPLALESIFGNLITNAIKYTPEGGRIDVSAERVGVNIRVRVADTGFGIPEKHLDKIFDRFYRVKDDNTRYINGTGLGLPIVRGLVDALGGMIDVESEPGKGSVFSVLLPVEEN